MAEDVKHMPHDKLGDWSDAATAGMPELSELLTRRIDEMLAHTRERQMVSSAEVQDFCLDLRSLIRELSVSRH